MECEFALFLQTRLDPILDRDRSIAEKYNKKILLIIIAILPKSLHLSLIFATIRAAFDLCSTINWDTNKRKSEHASIYLNQKRIKGS